MTLIGDTDTSFMIKKDKKKPLKEKIAYDIDEG